MAQGKKGQVVYPAGVYGNTVSYTTTETKRPYVYEASDGNFYVLNAIMTWLGTEQNNRNCITKLWRTARFILA